MFAVMFSNSFNFRTNPNVGKGKNFWKKVAVSTENIWNFGKFQALFQEKVNICNVVKNMKNTNDNTKSIISMENENIVKVWNIEINITINNNDKLKEKKK